MNTHEDSMPLRFTPDGLDEATIDALIDAANAQFSDVPSNVSMDLPVRRPIRRQAGRRSPNGRAA